MKFFNEIRLRTPESVELEFPLSGIGSRAYALFVDYTLLSLGIAGFLFLWSIVSYQLVQYFPSAPGLGSWLIAIPVLLCFVIFVGYFVLFETLWQGQTPGKRLAQIRVIRDDGRPIALPQATLRALLRTFDDLSFFVVGFLLIVVGKKEKRLGDWVAGTVVIQEQRSKPGTIQVLDEAKARQVADSLREEQDISRLLPDDFAVVREYLKRRSKLSNHARATVSLRLAQQVQQRLGMDGLPFNMSPNSFLEGVYLAYGQKG
ncbi:MAG: RDD family protein [Alkalinema sp. FL-bin-369]|nr:RDD family protein [Leptolyngbyaceae cyanobacterium LF-bin-369]